MLSKLSAVLYLKVILFPLTGSGKVTSDLATLLVSPGRRFYSEKVPRISGVRCALGLLPAIGRLDFDPVLTFYNMALVLPKMGLGRSRLGSPERTFMLSAARYFSLVARSIYLN